MSFDQLKALLRLPDDRLMAHTHTLVREGWLVVTKSLESGEYKPRATFAITDEGRASLSNYLGELVAMAKEIKRHVAKGETAASKSSGDNRYSSN
jgi:DNA-binding PadR family transcriptional regulator